MILFLSFQTEDEKQKFEYIYYNYKNLLLSKAYGILKDYMLAEDATSEAFIRIYKNLHKIDTPNSKRSIAFIVMIVRNTALTLLEKKKKSETDELEDIYKDDFNLEESIINNLSAQEIYEIIETLNDELKIPFIYRYTYDMSSKDIGEALQLTENVVNVRIYRAKKKLAEILKKEEYRNEKTKQ